MHAASVQTQCVSNRKGETHGIVSNYLLDPVGADLARRNRRARVAVVSASELAGYSRALYHHRPENPETELVMSWPWLITRDEKGKPTNVEWLGSEPLAELGENVPEHFMPSLREWARKHGLDPRVGLGPDREQNREHEPP